MTEQHPDAKADEPAPSPRQRFYQIINRLTFELGESAEGFMPRGDLAALRRDDGALSPTFYKLAARCLEDVLGQLAYEPVRVEAERRWARVVHCIARVDGQHKVGAPSLGAVLAEVDLAEARFLRLVRAEGDATDAAIRAALAPLVQKGTVLDVSDLAALILSAPHPTQRFHFEDGDSVRRRLARDYYRALRKNTEGASS